MTYYSWGWGSQAKWGWGSSWSSNKDWFANCKFHYEPKTTIKGSVWDDKDCDGKEDWYEHGVEDVVVNLIDKKGDIVESTTTDWCGNYKFKVDAGKYKIQVERPDGYEFTEQEAAGTNKYNNSNVDESGMSDFYDFRAGKKYSQLDAGLKEAKFEIKKDIIELDDDVDSFSFNILDNDTSSAELDVVAVNVGTGDLRTDPNAQQPTVGSLIFDFRPDNAADTQTAKVFSREGVKVELTLSRDGDLTIDTDLAFKGKVDGFADDLVSFDYRATDGDQTGNAIVAFRIDDYDIA